MHASLIYDDVGILQLFLSSLRNLFAPLHANMKRRHVKMIQLCLVLYLKFQIFSEYFGTEYDIIMFALIMFFFSSLP